MLQTLLTMQVSLCYSILTLLTIRATYAGNIILNTVTEKYSYKQYGLLTPLTI